jgi:hypothetical protein
MSNVRYDMANMASLGVASVTINSATTTTFDFGTPDDLNLAALSGYNPGDRVLVILSATTAGTTNNLTWVVQDAADSSGSIGTPAAATLSAVRGALAAGTANDFSAFAVQVQPGRPWLRVKVTSDGATDTFVTHCTVWAIPNGV